MAALSILQPPQAAVTQGPQNRCTEIKSFNSKDRQELFIYALISMHAPGPF